jgi:superkiller protein 3
MEKFEMAIKIEPESEDGYRLKGEALFDQEKYEKSIEFWQKAWELSKDYAWLLKKGIALRKMDSEKRKENQKEAMAIFDEVLKNDENYGRAWVEKGHCYWNLKNDEEAEVCYLKATKLLPENVDAWSSLGDIARVGRKSYGEALMFYDKALLYEKTNPEIYLSKAYALKNLKRYPEAIKCYNEVLELDEKHEDAFFSKAVCLGLSKNYQESNENFKKFIEKFPESSTNNVAWSNIALGQNTLGKHEDALNSCEESLKINNKYTRAYEQKVRALRELKRYPDAIIWVEKLLNLPNCDMKNSIKELIRLYRRTGDEDKQKEYEKKLKELDEGT